MTAINDRGEAFEAAGPRLLILTGASHTGKTSVAREVLRLLPAPAAFLSVDETIHTALVRPPGDPWAQIPLAYELLRLQAEALLDRGWLVVFESTFTYVPASGRPQFHGDELERLIGVAKDRKVPWTVAQLGASPDELGSRVAETNRLPRSVVDRTAELHGAAALPETTLRLDSGAEAPQELARRITAELSRRSDLA